MFQNGLVPAINSLRFDSRELVSCPGGDLLNWVFDLMNSPNPVKHVAMDGVFVCAALTSHYVIFNVATGTCQDLFPYEPETQPIITRISKASALLIIFI